uniref:Uncharacterized protein n=1 Tax=Anopheles coluzzii TaxID=1518534 RepID=A0A8W7PA98_ANOCL
MTTVLVGRPWIKLSVLLFVCQPTGRWLGSSDPPPPVVPFPPVTIAPALVFISSDRLAPVGRCVAELARDRLSAVNNNTPEPPPMHSSAPHIKIAYRSLSGVPLAEDPLLTTMLPSLSIRLPAYRSGLLLNVPVLARARCAGPLTPATVPGPIPGPSSPSSPGSSLTPPTPPPPSRSLLSALVPHWYGNRRPPLVPLCLLPSASVQRAELRVPVGTVQRDVGQKGYRSQSTTNAGNLINTT